MKRKKTCTLQELTKEQVDMFTTVFIGSSRTSFQNGLLVTKRGYEKRVAVNRAGGKEKLRILLFGGTTEGRELALTSVDSSSHFQSQCSNSIWRGTAAGSAAGNDSGRADESDTDGAGDGKGL